MLAMSASCGPFNALTSGLLGLSVLADIPLQAPFKSLAESWADAAHELDGAGGRAKPLDLDFNHWVQVELGEPIESSDRPSRDRAMF
ncbi:hypothetical protein JJB98_27215 [Bradyrhizobium diazoefficiens]|nr:hypothetical protein [Bradyrhizobium diazoefficiens]QQO23363.1 hypothetical protein JJB98_27215 [Bradyrhizobium diazoefficiens]